MTVLRIREMMLEAHLAKLRACHEFFARGLAMADYSIRQLATELPFPEFGKKSVIVQDDERTKVVLFAFAAGAGLAEHVAPLPAILQIVAGEAALTVGDEPVEGRPGTWISMPPQTRHSIAATAPTLLLLTLLKN